MEKMEKLISVSPVYYAPKSKELTAKLKYRELSLTLYKIIKFYLAWLKTGRQSARNRLDGL